MTPIAVVGIDCRFPGAPDKDAFWRLLMDGIVTDTEVPSQRWDIDTHYHPDGVAGSMNTRRAHFIDDVDAFDNDFFGIAPIEAAALDPQQRLLLAGVVARTGRCRNQSRGRWPARQPGSTSE